MGDIERAISSKPRELCIVEIVVVVVFSRLQRCEKATAAAALVEGTYLFKILFTSIPGPGIPAVCRPLIERRFAAPDPRVVVETATAAKDLTARVGLFEPLVVWLIDKDGLVCPVIGTIPQLECAGRRVDLGDLSGVTFMESVSRTSIRSKTDDTDSTPASISKILTLGFSANLPATTFPAVPPG